ncbi:MAG: hypothetical protein J5641_02335 [Bacteroidales bacterium]|nr:hypothetical protein [Bacteroidales bacterium]
MSAVDNCVIVTFMQLLPLLQHPCWAGSTKLTFPEQEHRCHPMPLLPNNSNISVEIVTIMCDNVLMAESIVSPTLDGLITFLACFYCP